MQWCDKKLSWNASDYGGLKEIRLPHDRIWKPVRQVFLFTLTKFVLL